MTLVLGDLSHKYVEAFHDFLTYQSSGCQLTGYWQVVELIIVAALNILGQTTWLLHPSHLAIADNLSSWESILSLVPRHMLANLLVYSEFSVLLRDIWTCSRDSNEEHSRNILIISEVKAFPTLNSTIQPLTSSRNFSASDALPAATHWNVAFCPALTSSSPSLEKCGALSEERHMERETEVRRLHYLFAVYSVSPLHNSHEKVCSQAEMYWLYLSLFTLCSKWLCFNN